MNLLELLHNEKVVKSLEAVDNELKDLLEPSENDNAIFLKIVLILETLLKNKRHTNSHIGRFFERYSNTQGEIDDLTEDIKQKDVKISELSYNIDMTKVEIEELEWKLKELKGKVSSDTGEIESIKGKLEGLKWEPVKLQDWIEQASHPIEKNNTEGFVFEKLREVLINKHKLNYNYGKERDNKN